MSGIRADRRALPREPVLLFREGRAAATGVRVLREAAGLSQADFARRLGCDVTWIRRREGHSVRMTRSEAGELAAALGTDLAGLLEAGAPPGGGAAATRRAGVPGD